MKVIYSELSYSYDIYLPLCISYCKLIDDLKDASYSIGEKAEKVGSIFAKLSMGI